MGKKYIILWGLVGRLRMYIVCTMVVSGFGIGSSMVMSFFLIGGVEVSFWGQVTPPPRATTAMHDICMYGCMGAPSSREVRSWKIRREVSQKTFRAPFEGISCFLQTCTMCLAQETWSKGWDIVIPGVSRGATASIPEYSLLASSRVCSGPKYSRVQKGNPYPSRVLRRESLYSRTPDRFSEKKGVPL